MVVVTVELWPGGKQAKAQLLGRAVIVNDETSATADRGNYDVRLTRFQERTTWKQTRVKDFHRKRQTPWHLLRLALDQIFE